MVDGSLFAEQRMRGVLLAPVDPHGAPWQVLSRQDIPCVVVDRAGTRTRCAQWPPTTFLADCSRDGTSWKPDTAASPTSAAPSSYGRYVTGGTASCVLCGKPA